MSEEHWQALQVRQTRELSNHLKGVCGYSDLWAGVSVKNYTGQQPDPVVPCPVLLGTSLDMTVGKTGIEWPRCLWRSRLIAMHAVDQTLVTRGRGDYMHCFLVGPA